MLGKYVKVRIICPMNSFDREKGIFSKLNYGTVESGLAVHAPVKGAYIMGVNHKVRKFEGRVIAVLKPKSNADGVVLVVAPKSKRYIIHQITDALSFAFPENDYDINCLYETSCGAVIYRISKGEIQFLLIKNKRSANWGFPKGHMERGESEKETAVREVLEETGINIRFLPDFRYKSEYSIQNRIEKRVIIFLASTDDEHITIQQEEIDEYLWADFDNALSVLKFANDKYLLKKANDYLLNMEETNCGEHN